MVVRGLLAWGLLVSLQIPAAADPALDKARDFLKTGRVDAASAIYQAYLQQHATSLQARLALAEISMRRFEYEKARSMLEKALAQHPESGETAAHLGRLFQLWSNSPAGKVADNNRDYHALAQEHFRQAEAISPDDPTVLTYLAEWKMQQNDMIATEQLLEKALRNDPAFLPAHQAMVRFYIKVKDLARAKNAALHAIELNPQDATSYFLTAQLLALANHPAEAMQYAEKSEQLDYGRMPERDYFLATQAEKLGQLEKAAQHYQTLATYTPRDAQVWLRLGELHASINQPEASQKAYQRAVALNPDILNDLYRQARENTRAEKIDVALNQWHKLLALQPDKPDTQNEAFSAIAGLHYLKAFYLPSQPSQSNSELTRDLQAVEAALQLQPNAEARLLDKAKLRIAMQHELTPTARQDVMLLVGAQDPSIAGEAYFLLGNYAKAAEKLEAVDGLSAEEYAQLADRLLLVQELTFSRLFYQRAYELSPSPDLETAMKRIAAKQTLATQKVTEGNQLFGAKDYTGALAKYQEAVRIYRQGDNAYLRLADTHEQLKQWPEAKAAYDTAIMLSPNLLNSEGFTKHYNKLKKRTATR